MWLRSRGAHVWLLYLLHLVCLTPSSACPQPDVIRPCQCSSRGDEVQIWCSQSELSGVLSGLAALGTQLSKPIDELILENNVMTALPGRAFAPLRVVRLMLRDNRLERLAANWLAGLETSLMEVFIVEQELRSLPEDSFEGLAKLEAVTLKAGLITRLPSFAGLAKLRYLNIELPSLTELTPGRLNNMESLEQLHLVASPLLTTLEASSLQDTPRLVLANFSSSGITWLHPRAFMRLPSLKELDLSNNKLVDAGEVGRSIREMPHLTVLRLDQNKIETLKETTFVDIPPLMELYLNRNQITDIHRGAFHRLPSLVKLDLSDNRIRRINPEFFLESFDSRIEELLLVNNQLDHVMFLAIVLDTLPRLKSLDMSHNRLHDIMFGAIRGHPTLERLHLNSNLLKRVVREAFHGMPALRELRLSNNSLSNYLEMPLWNLPSLKGLDLSHNEFRRLDRRVLANLPSLRRFDMALNSLVVVDPASFLGTTALEHVNLSHNAIDLVAPHTFSHLNNLFELDLASNRLQSLVPGLPSALELLHMANNKIGALPRSPSPGLLLPALRLLDLNGNLLHTLPPEGLISMPLLRKLYIGENSLSRIEERSFDGLGRLEQLDLHDNRIQEIQSNAFRDVRRLEELNLSGNRLANLLPGQLKENTKLRRIDLSRNQLVDVPKESFNNNREITEVMLSHNALASFPTAVMELPKICVLDVSYNRIGQLLQPLHKMKSLQRLRLTGNKLQALMEGTFVSMANLTTLELDSNQIQYLTPHVVRSLPRLTTLRLSDNRLSTIPSAAFSDLPSLLEVELQNNHLSQVASDAFSGVPSLLSMNLSHNQLTGLDRAGLHGLKSVEVLDLSHNKVTRLNAPNLPNLDALIQLKMDGNKICIIQGSPFTKMSHLRMLSLRNNRLVSLSETAFQPLRSTIYLLDIEGNPLKCSCSLLWLQSWVREGPHQGPKCSDGTLLKDHTIRPEDCSYPRSSQVVQACDDTPPLVPVLGATQQLSSVANNWKDTGKKPTPEESEYFYDEYVEYDENVTLPMNVTQTVASHHDKIAGASTSTVIPPAVLSHFISGDTPTIYAKPNFDNLTAMSPTKPPLTTFTFFGMPLPSLNIGKFWGSTRNSEGGKSRFPGARGRVQQLESSPTKVEEGGFRPMLSSGGFRPIFNPYSAANTTARPVTASTAASKRVVTVASPPNSLIFPPSTSTISPRTSTIKSSDNWEIRKYSHSISTKNAVKKLNSDQPINSHEVTKEEITDLLDEKKHLQTINYEHQNNNFSLQSMFQFNKLDPETEATTKLIEQVFGAPEFFTSTSRPSSEIPLILQDSYEEGNDFVELTEQHDKSPEPTSGGPSPLSAFLAPGGQLPPFRSPGRPTITKVTVPPAVAEEIHLPAVGRQDNLPPGPSKPPPHLNKSMAWYYQNYNRSNLQPYIGLGMSTIPSGAQESYKFHISLFLLSVLVIFKSTWL